MTSQSRFSRLVSFRLGWVGGTSGRRLTAFTAFAAVSPASPPLPPKNHDPSPPPLPDPSPDAPCSRPYCPLRDASLLLQCPKREGAGSGEGGQR